MQSEIWFDDAAVPHRTQVKRSQMGCIKGISSSVVDRTTTLEQMVLKTVPKNWGEENSIDFSSPHILHQYMKTSKGWDFRVPWIYAFTSMFKLVQDVSYPQLWLWLNRIMRAQSYLLLVPVAALTIVGAFRYIPNLATHPEYLPIEHLRSLCGWLVRPHLKLPHLDDRG